MDSQRFDDLVRLIGSGATRRRVIKGALGSLAGFTFFRHSPRSVMAGEETCASDTESCSTDDECCDGLSCWQETSCRLLCDSFADCPAGYDACNPAYGYCQVGCVAEGENCVVGVLTCCGDLVCSHGSAGVCVSASGGCAGEGEACGETSCCDDLICSDGTCVTDEPPGCETDEDCGDGLACCEGVCGNQLCPDCETDDDCDGDEVCDDGFCTSPPDDDCETDDDCPGDTICIEGVCLLPPDDGCESDADCADGICCAGECRVLDCCIDDADPNAHCDDGETCVEGVCQPVEEPTPGSATVTIHLASCPTGVADIYGQCHDDGIAGVAFTVSSPDIVQIAATNTIVTDANGVATATVGIGGVTIVQDGSVASAYLGSYIYCSEQDSGTVLYDGSADSASVSFTVADGDQVICDWYSITEAEQDDDDEDDEDEDEDEDNVTDLPDTGTGPNGNGTSGLSGWLGAAALGAAAAALAGTKLRGTPGSDPAE